MHAGLFFGDFARFNHVGHERVVARDALKVAAMQQVGARIANLCHHEANSVEHGGGHGGSHALFAAPVDRGANNRAIRFDHGARKRIAVGGVGCVFDKRLDGDFAGNLTCRMAAHAVGDGEYGWGHGQAVFIMVANQADVGTRTVFGKIDLGVAAAALGLLCGGHYSYLTRMVTSPILTTSPLLSATGSAMRWPFTAVPFVEPKSSTNRFWPMMEKRAWRAET